MDDARRREQLTPTYHETESIALSLPQDLETALERDPEYRKGFEALSSEEKHDLIRWIESARDPEHRKQRLDMAIRSLR